MKVVASFSELTQAHALRLALEGEGVLAVVQGEYSVGIIDRGVVVAILNDADLTQAQEVIARFRMESPGSAA